MGSRVISGFKKAAVTRASILLASVMFFSSPDSISAGNLTDASLDPGQELLGKFVAAVSSSSVSFSYSYRIDDGKSEIRGDGTVKMQGSAYMVSGNGLEVYCDGETRWTVDRESREAVIESYDPAQPDYTVNPAVLLMHFDKAFTLQDSSVLDDGSVECHLEPAGDGVDMRNLTMVLSADGSRIIRAGFVTGVRTSAEFDISSFATGPAAPDTADTYSFDVSSLDSSYIVTDLR